jgi:threonine synthase
VYYFSAYADLLASGAISSGESVNFVVPTGNFGDILAGYYARNMGLPINKLICASNRNDVLTEFFATGIYSVHRMFYKTMSPSMDILVSSNLERLLFESADRDGELIKVWMQQL